VRFVLLIMVVPPRDFFAGVSVIRYLFGECWGGMFTLHTRLFWQKAGRFTAICKHTRNWLIKTGRGLIYLLEGSQAACLTIVSLKSECIFIKLEIQAAKLSNMKKKIIT